MKKKYIQPNCETFAMNMENGILAGSPQNVNPGGGDGNSDIKKDESSTGGWAASKGNDGSLWDTEEDF